MDPSMILWMVLASVAAALLYTAIGVAPGTDETAVLAPVTLALVLAGVPLQVVLAFFMSAIVAKKLTDSIPVAVAGIPGGVMAAPMVEHAMVLKANGRASTSIRKMASGSVIGTLVAVPASLLLAWALTPLADVIADYASIIFFVGAVVLALMSRHRWVALAAIVPFAVAIQGLRSLYQSAGAVPEGTTVFVSLFLGITIGPLVYSLFELLVGAKRRQLHRDSPMEITLHRTEPIRGLANPFRILDRKEQASAGLGAVAGTLTFFLTPVGMTILIGEALAARVKDTVARASRAISTMDSLTNAAYVSGVLVPLVALGLPISPMAIGPANALFNAPPVLTLEQNMHHLLTTPEIAVATVIGAATALLLTYQVTVRYAGQIGEFVFRRIPHEALLALFVALVVLLAFMDAGVLGIAGVLMISLLAGRLHRWGVNYGVMFMTLYAAPWLVMHLVIG
ncbi:MULTISPECIES: tripartite tricarboxylate transporter permease [unclassified Serinicoccus]|uniref:tripartite tricarboxylate transporter permease n=1 Tax=unclassified Serinicoccus TaxID=2643101 RepID=UPI00385537B2